MFNELSGSTTGNQTQELEESRTVLEVSDLQTRIDWLNAHKPFISQGDVVPIESMAAADTPTASYEL